MEMRDLVISVESLKKLSSLDIKIELAYKIAKFIKEVESELTIFSEKRTSLYKKYGEKDKQGIYTVGAENQKEFSEKMEELLDLELELNIPEVDLKDLQSEQNTLSVSDVLNLQFLLSLE